MCKGCAGAGKGAGNDPFARLGGTAGKCTCEETNPACWNRRERIQGRNWVVSEAVFAVVKCNGIVVRAAVALCHRA